MSVKKEYSCNVCNNLVSSDDEATGIYTEKEGGIGEIILVATSIDNADFHICNSCLKGIRNIENRGIFDPKKLAA